MTENSPLLSIVVPATRLHGNSRNLQSWIQQLPEDDVSVVIVHDIQDDLTSHDLHEMLRGLPKEKVRLHEETFNSPGLARNIGIKTSRSEWIWFVDADDLPEVEQAIKMIKEAEENTEVLVGNYRINQGGHDLAPAISRKFSPVSLVAYSPGIWRMVFRSSSLQDLYFSHLKMAEDQLFILQYDFSSRKIEFSERVVYTYFKNIPGQLTSQKSAVSDISKVIPITFKVFQNSTHLSQEFAAIMLVRQVITKSKNSNAQGMLRSMFSGSQSLKHLSLQSWLCLFQATTKVIRIRVSQDA